MEQGYACEQHREVGDHLREQVGHDRVAVAFVLADEDGHLEGDCGGEMYY